MNIFTAEPTTSIRLPVNSEIISISKINGSWEIKYQSLVGCQHESDGVLKPSDKVGRLEYKCKKCGGFYR